MAEEQEVVVAVVGSETQQLDANRRILCPVELEELVHQVEVQPVVH